MAVLMGASLVLIAAAAGILAVGWLSANPTMIVASMGGLVVAGVLLLIAYVRSRRIVASVAPVLPAAAPAGVHLVPGEGPVGAVEAPAPHRPVATQEPAPEPGDAGIAPLPVPGAASMPTVAEEGREPTAPQAAPRPVRAGAKGSAARSTKSTGGKPKGSTSKGSSRSASTRAGTKATGTSKTTAGRAAAAKGAAKQPPKVVVLEGRDKYHRPGCRFAKGRGAERVTKATARRWGYEPCSICDP